jgi:hydroxyacylglutathione hydrolase
MRIVGLPVGPLAVNCWLVIDDERGELAIVDPGDEAGRIASVVSETGCTPVAIWLTHAHFDHLGAVEELSAKYGVPVYLHESDLPLYDGAARQAASYGLRIDQPTAVPRSVREGDTVSVGALSFQVIHAPGHAPGHVVLYGHGVALVGDCLFAGSIGRTDLPLSDPAAMERSLGRLLQLPDDTRVFPGHGPETTIGAERRSNPFLTGAARLKVS